MRRLAKTWALPKIEWTTATLPQIIDDVLHSPLFQIVLGCILFVLAFVKAVTMAVAVAIALAWTVTVYGVVRYRRIQSLSPKARLAITVLCAFGLFFPAWAFDRWAIRQLPNPNAVAQQPRVSNEPPRTVPIPTPEPVKPKVTKAPRKVSPQPQETAAPKVTTNPIGPRLGTGPDAYKDISDDQLSQWTTEEADKLYDMAWQHLNVAPIIRKAYEHWFSADFKSCCAQDVKDLRSELLRRLGPPAKNPAEESTWKMVFRDLDFPPGVPIPPNFSQIDPSSVIRYVPYLRELAIKLKARNMPNLAPLGLGFSETQVASENPKVPYRIIVTIETKEELGDGVIAVHFNGTFGTIGCDYQGPKPVLGFHELDEETTAGKKIVGYKGLMSHYIFKISKVPFLPGKPIHVIESGGKDFHVSDVSFLSEYFLYK